jgi:hypothetical protein
MSTGSVTVSSFIGNLGVILPQYLRLVSKDDHGFVPAWRPGAVYFHSSQRFSILLLSFLCSIEVNHTAAYDLGHVLVVTPVILLAVFQVYRC